MTRILVFLTLAYALGIALGRFLSVQAGIYLAVGAPSFNILEFTIPIPVEMCNITLYG